MSPEAWGIETEKPCPETGCFARVVRTTTGTLKCPECGAIREKDDDT